MSEGVKLRHSTRTRGSLSLLRSSRQHAVHSYYTTTRHHTATERVNRRHGEEQRASQCLRMKLVDEDDNESVLMR